MSTQNCAARSLLTIVIFTIALTLPPAFKAETDHPRSRMGTGTRVKYEHERSTAYWMEQAQLTLAEKLRYAAADADASGEKQRPAKNVILFLGDGMSVQTVTASRNMLGDSSDVLAFERFRHVGLAKTYCVDRQVADSACSATAYLAGVKANYGTIGVDAHVTRRNCTTVQNPAYHVHGMAKWAQDAGKHTGLVTSARVTHATPASVYAHVADRYWEDDTELEERGCRAAEVDDIAKQLVDSQVGRNLRVIMGGGRRHFLPHHANDEEGLPGNRKYGGSLIYRWLMDKRIRQYEAQYVWSRKGLMDLDLQKTDFLLGLFANSHCSYHGDLARKHLLRAEPTLTEMTEAAIKVLQRNDKGYFLFVEGARIDMAHHETNARKSLEDTLEFANAVAKAREMSSEEDTLIVVTADHSHTMTINGYPHRDVPITSLSDTLADDDLPFTILSYANGPGFSTAYDPTLGRVALKAKHTEDPEFLNMATAPINSETHGGDDVAVYASGPYAQYFSGNYEQTNIPAMMARAANIGPFAV